METEIVPAGRSRTLPHPGLSVGCGLLARKDWVKPSQLDGQ